MQGKPSADRRRKSKFDCKIRWALDVDFPYFVVASKELECLDELNTLKIVDGIIGNALARSEFSNALATEVLIL